jgi:hypothetical protein
MDELLDSSVDLDCKELGRQRKVCKIASELFVFFRPLPLYFKEADTDYKWMGKK